MKSALIHFCFSVVTAATASAFVSVTNTQSRPLLASTVSDDPVGLVELKRASPAKRGPVPSRSIPFLTCNPLLDGELAGDVGFDPLNFAKNKEALWEFREAEVKHARLAMLAAVGWPISELLDRSIAEYFGVLSPLDDADRVPSILNGGLDKIPPAWWGFCLGMTAAIDSYGIQKARSAGSESGYTPGDLGWDPLSLYPTDKQGKMDMQLKEIKHGRVAMLAVVAFSAQEYSSKLGVVDETPFFFQPFTQTAETFLQSIVGN